jgi:hypothetical protein
MTRRSTCTQQNGRSGGIISARDCLVLFLAAHAAVVVGLLVYASGAPATAAVVAAGQAFLTAFQLADRIISPGHH